MIPSIYQELAYIGSSNELTQYIDTRLTGGSNPEYEIRFAGNTGVSWAQFFAGSKEPNRIGAPAKIFRWAADNSLCIQGYNQSDGMHRVYKVPFEPHCIHCTNSVLRYDTQVLSRCTKPASSWGDLSYYVFNSHEENKLPSKMDLYRLKMWSDNRLARDFIPCYIIATGEAGLYEAVEDKFYGNDGTGEFIKGPEIHIVDSPILGPCPGLYDRILRKRQQLKQVRPMRKPEVWFTVEPKTPDYGSNSKE